MIKCTWSEEQFEEVDWDLLDAILSKKREGYKTWLSKQHTKFCGTTLQVAYYKGLKGKQVECSNCNKPETAANLRRCPSEGEDQTAP